MLGHTGILYKGEGDKSDHIWFFFPPLLIKVHASTYNTKGSYQYLWSPPDYSKIMNSSSFLQFGREIRVKIQNFKPWSSGIQNSLPWSSTKAAFSSCDVFLRVEWQLAYMLKWKHPLPILLHPFGRKEILMKSLCIISLCPANRARITLVFSAIHIISFSSSVCCQTSTLARVRRNEGCSVPVREMRKGVASGSIAQNRMGTQGKIHVT